MFKHFMSTMTVISVSISIFFFACADVSELDDQDSSNKSGGTDLYTCQVATIDSYGSQWTYQTSPMNTSVNQIQLYVYQNDTMYGPIPLNQVSSGVFSDNNLSVKLVNFDGKRSIAVEHANVSLYARAENGWCSAHNTPSTNSDSDSSIGGYDTFSIKVDSECENPCSFAVNTNMSVSFVVYEVDGYPIGELNNGNQGFAASYTFNTFGLRNITATGYDSHGNFVANDSESFTITTGQNDTYDEYNPHGNQNNGGYGQGLDVPYYYQYNNNIEGWATCQNTSIAMVLEHLGASIHPDVITREFGRKKAQRVYGLESVFNTFANRLGVRGITSYDHGTMAQVKASLDRGNPVIIHGFFTYGGHVVVVTGYDEYGYFVNDPAGKWDGKFKSSNAYPNAYDKPLEGKNVYYSKAAFEMAVGSHTGTPGSANLNSMWIHIIN